MAVQLCLPVCTALLGAAVQHAMLLLLLLRCSTTPPTPLLDGPLMQPNSPLFAPEWAGLVANVLVENLSLGPVAPFDAAATVLTVGGCIIAWTWSENYGDASASSSTTDGFKKAAQLIWNGEAGVGQIHAKSNESCLDPYPTGRVST